MSEVEALQRELAASGNSDVYCLAKMTQLAERLERQRDIAVEALEKVTPSIRYSSEWRYAENALAKIKEIGT